MNILVCVKQVPDTTEIKINPETNTLIRDGVPSIVNTFDAFALEAAARIKDKDPETKIVVVSMGPEQAKNALKECLAIAADKAYLVSDRVFGGSDTLASLPDWFHIEISPKLGVFLRRLRKMLNGESMQMLSSILAQFALYWEYR